MGLSDSKPHHHRLESSDALVFDVLKNVVDTLPQTKLGDYSCTPAGSVSCVQNDCFSTPRSSLPEGGGSGCVSLNSCHGYSYLQDRLWQDDWDSNHNEVNALLENQRKYIFPGTSNNGQLASKNCLKHETKACDQKMAESTSIRNNQKPTNSSLNKSRPSGKQLPLAPSCSVLDAPKCPPKRNSLSFAESVYTIRPKDLHLMRRYSAETKVGSASKPDLGKKTVPDNLPVEKNVVVNFFPPAADDRCDRLSRESGFYSLDSKSPLDISKDQECSGSPWDSIYDNWSPSPSISQPPTWCRNDNYLLKSCVEEEVPSYCNCTGIYCNYTCHLRCKNLVTLNCKNQATELNDDDPSTSSSEAPLLDEVNCREPESVYAETQINVQELRQHVERYNATACGSELSLSEDGMTYSGVIRVHMNLCRPINVVCGARPPSIYDIIYDDDGSLEKKTLTSFYLPRDTVKALHIDSETSTKEVISALLKKFKVVDNPHKFALYERYFESEESMRVKMRRILDSEKPLALLLAWSAKDLSNRQFVLQENDTGDIPWDAFSLPELNNFLRILEREEEEYLNQVRLKYQLFGEKLREAMEYLEVTGQTTTRLDGFPHAIFPQNDYSTLCYFENSNESQGKCNVENWTLPDSSKISRSFTFDARGTFANSPLVPPFPNPPGGDLTNFPTVQPHKLPPNPNRAAERSKTVPSSLHLMSPPVVSDKYSDVPKSKHLLDVT